MGGQEEPRANRRSWDNRAVDEQTGAARNKNGPAAVTPTQAKVIQIMNHPAPVRSLRITRNVWIDAIAEPITRAAPSRTLNPPPVSIRSMQACPRALAARELTAAARTRSRHSRPRDQVSHDGDPMPSICRHRVDDRIINRIRIFSWSRMVVAVGIVRRWRWVIEWSSSPESGIIPTLRRQFRGQTLTGGKSRWHSPRL